MELRWYRENTLRPYIKDGGFLYCELWMMNRIKEEELRC